MLGMNKNLLILIWKWPINLRNCIKTCNSIREQEIDIQKGDKQWLYLKDPITITKWVTSNYQNYPNKLWSCIWKLRTMDIL